MSHRLCIDTLSCRKLRTGSVCHRLPNGRYPCEDKCQEAGASLIVETKTGDPYACMQCRYDQKAASPPCMFTERRRNASFSNILGGEPDGIVQIWELCPADAIKIDDHGVWIEQEKCVGCLLCAAACPISAITIDQSHKAHLFSNRCKDRFVNPCPWGAISFKKTDIQDVEEFQRLQKEKERVICQDKELLSYLGSMRFEKVTFPTSSYLNKSQVHKTNFEEFLAIDEENILTPWMGEALKRISEGYVASSYEARLPNKPGLRYPRLDFCVIDKNAVLVIESKRDEVSARSGIVDQIRKKYREEIRRILSEKREKIWNLLLVTGGPEKSTMRSEYLLTLLSSNGIQLVSPTLVWCLLAYNLLIRMDLPWSSVLPKIFANAEVIAAFASGVVTREESGQFVRNPIDRLIGGRCNPTSA